MIFSSKEAAEHELRLQVSLYVLKSFVQGNPIKAFGSFQNFILKHASDVLQQQPSLVSNLMDNWSFALQRRFFENFVAVYGYEGVIRDLCAPDHLEVYSGVKL